MARGPLSFKQRDLTRAIKAALTAGLVIERAWIDINGRIMLGFAKAVDDQNPAPERQEGNTWADVA